MYVYCVRINDLTLPVPFNTQAKLSMCYFNTQAITLDAINVLEFLFKLLYVVLRGPSSTTTKLKTDLRQTEILWSPLGTTVTTPVGLTVPPSLLRPIIS